MSTTKKSEGFVAPNYTQTPNTLFDLLPVMSSAELRVTLVIVRETFGWHRQRTSQLSIPEIAERGGLSDSSTKTGIKEGLQRGTLKKFKARDDKNRVTFRYGLVISERVNFDLIERPKKEGIEGDADSENQEVSSQNLTGLKFDRVDEGIQSKFDRVPPQIPVEVSSQILTGLYKEERNSIKDKKEKREGTAFPAHKNHSSEIEEFETENGTPPDGGAANAATPEQDRHSQDKNVSSNAENDNDTDLEKIPGGGAAAVDPAVEAYIRRKLSHAFVDSLLEEVQPLGVNRRTDWFALPLERVEEIFGEAVRTHKRLGLRVPTRVRELLDDECAQQGLRLASPPEDEDPDADPMEALLAGASLNGSRGVRR